jgi:hypothetical protein
MTPNRADRRRAAKEETKTPAPQPQAPAGQLDADKLFARIGQLDYTITELRQEIARLYQQNELLQETIESLTPKPPKEDTRTLEEVEAEGGEVANQESFPDPPSVGHINNGPN